MMTTTGNMFVLALLTCWWCRFVSLYKAPLHKLTYYSVSSHFRRRQTVVDLSRSRVRDRKQEDLFGSWS
jgi:hypothetical protein